MAGPAEPKKAIFLLTTKTIVTQVISFVLSPRLQHRKQGKAFIEINSH